MDGRVGARERREKEREGSELEWDVNAYFAPLREKKCEKGDRGTEGKRRDEWECEFCGGECFWSDQDKNQDGVEEKDMVI